MKYNVGDKVYFNAYIPKNNKVFIGCGGYILASYSTIKYKVIISEVWPKTISDEYKDDSLLLLIGQKIIRNIDGIEKKKAVWWGNEVISKYSQKIIETVNRSKKQYSR